MGRFNNDIICFVQKLEYEKNKSKFRQVTIVQKKDYCLK